jgi:hypothetical protein
LHFSNPYSVAGMQNLNRNWWMQPGSNWQGFRQRILLTTIVFTTRFLCLWSGLCLYHCFRVLTGLIHIVSETLDR